jgi:hypothetical protein
VETALALACIRLGLAVAGLAAAIAFGVHAAVAVTAFAAGIVLLGCTLITTRRRMWSGRDVRVERPWHAALAATYPSTIGLTVLTVLALELKPQLAAYLAGLIAGLGFAAAAVAAQITWARR